MQDGKVSTQQGSSPRMRGAQCYPVAKSIWTRIIPADAGSTLNYWTYLSPIKDHPRGCGEHSESHVFCCPWWGSSPRMRGAQYANPCVALISRIIPADAGSTRHCIRAQRPYGDHPRGCGEHLASILSICGDWGSSPRMRGAPPGSCSSRPCPRIIPADAGSTVSL